MTGVASTSWAITFQCTLSHLVSTASLPSSLPPCTTSSLAPSPISLVPPQSCLPGPAPHSRYSPNPWPLMMMCLTECLLPLPICLLHSPLHWMMRYYGWSINDKWFPGGLWRRWRWRCCFPQASGCVGRIAVIGSLYSLSPEQGVATWYDRGDDVEVWAHTHFI